MDLSRRAFSKSSLGILAGLAASAGMPLASVLGQVLPTRGRQRFFDWTVARIDSENFWGVMCSGPSWASTGGNSLLVKYNDESVLIDTKNCGFGMTLRQEAFATAEALPTYIINTHHHADHVGGNPTFKKDMAIHTHPNAVPRIVAQTDRMVATAKRMLDALESAEGMDDELGAKTLNEVRQVVEGIATVKPEDFAPTAPFPPGREKWSGLVGREIYGVHHFGNGHTDNDLVIHFPTLNVVHTGDLVFNKRHPFIDRAAGATTVGWQEALKKTMELCNESTVVVPGHGPMTDMAGIQEQIDYFDKLREIVSYAKNVDGMTREEVVKLESGAFPGYEFQQIWPVALGAMYDELSEQE